MSLADQSQQWFPTSVQVTVHQARNLRVKGKNDTNDAYAIIQVAKDKFSTSVAEKSVAPVWKEEASFDLPLFHPGNAERCTLYIIVMHRAQVGLDKFLGQAVINLLDQHDNKSRKKTDWFKLVDKSGKEDKARGEVLLDIQFMRNNMSASMFDLSMQDKPRSRISKLKDKVRGKKKNQFSDSASAIVPSVSQVLTDSDGEADSVSLNQTPGEKKKSKLKKLFAPKSNLQKNMSQSMSTLGTLPEKNSSLSGSRSSGLNVDSPEVKKKFKFLGHKRTGSSDSKVSQGPFSLLGRSKHSTSDLNNLCINGSHVYAEDTEPKSGSTLSLNSSGQGSVEDVQKHTSDVYADSFKSVPVPSHSRESSDRAILEQQRHQEEDERRQAEERRIADAKRLEEEEKCRAEAKKLQEEKERMYKEDQDRKRRFLEDEARKKKQREEEEDRKKQEEERRMMEAAENQRLEEERRRLEEQKQQEEASMSDRLTSLFGMIRKKEEKKEEIQQNTKEELPTPAPRSVSRAPDQSVYQQSTKPDISLSSDTTVSSNESPADHQKSNRTPQTPSAMVFLNRTAKVSAVKPRLAQSLTPEPTESLTPSQQYPSPATSESTLSSIPSESPDTFTNLHSSLAPPNISLFGSPRGSIERLSSVGSSPTMADKKRRAPQAPMNPVHETQTRGNHVPVREITNPGYVEADGSQQGRKVSLPLPDYETLFPQKRHGVQGQTRWDHIIAEVNQRHRETPSELLGPEMSVDGPEVHESHLRSSIPHKTHYQTQSWEAKPISSKKVAAPAPPKPVVSPQPRSVSDSSQRQTQNVGQAYQSLVEPNPSAAPGPLNTDTSSRGRSLPVTSRDGAKKALQPPSAAVLVPRPNSQMDWDATPTDDQRKVQVTMNKEAPTAKPRQKVSGNEPVEQGDSAVTPIVSNKHMNSTFETSSSSMSNMYKKAREAKENFAEFDPFPNTELLSKDPWTQLSQNQKANDLFTSSMQKEQKPEDCGLTASDLDQIFNQEKPTDPFTSFNEINLDKQNKYRKKYDDSKQLSPALQRKNLQKREQILNSITHSAKGKSGQEPAYQEEMADQGFPARHVANESVTLQHRADVKTQNNFYGEDDRFEASTVTSSEPLQLVMEEPASQAGGKMLLRAWVSPSEVQPVSAQNSNGGGLALTPRRPHPVKPMSSAETQHPISIPAVKEIKARDSTPAKFKVAESGPYTQLTQEELITLVVKQQTDLSRKDAKIVELEEYIDNLLVRVIEEHPTILQALNAAKPV
ncbi:hypothetical protein PAMP_022210 [Pampus punctatissimus]